MKTDSAARRLAQALVGAMLLLGGGFARADEPEAAPSEAVLAEARDAFRLGSALARQGQWVEALAAFGRSDRLHAHAVTTYNIGYCERSLGHYTRARKAFQKSLSDEARDFGVLPADLALAARGYVDDIDAGLARAIVTLPDAQTALAVDGRPLEVSDAAGPIPELVAGTRDHGPPERTPSVTFRLLLDPGTHVFVLSREGAEPRVVSRLFAAGESATLSFVEAGSSKPDPGRRAEPSRAAAYVAFGFGGVGLTVGAILGGVALAKKGRLDEVCPEKNRCPDDARGDIDALGHAADAATVALVIGLAGAGLGTVLFFAPPARGAPPASGAASLGLWIGPGAGLSGEISW